MTAGLRIVKPSITPGTDLAQQWANKINASLAATVEKVIEAGRLLIEAKEGPLKVKRGWLRMFKDHRDPIAQPLRIGRSMAHKLMAIARHPIVGNVDHGLHFPSEWTHLYQLSTLPAPIQRREFAEWPLIRPVVVRELGEPTRKEFYDTRRNA
jgi:hypothetical protein